jgi:SdrD B-like domain/Secretion system C-terminal sorting domain
MKNFKGTLVFFLFALSIINANAQINGTVFQDFNGNGLKDNIAATPTTVALQEIPVSGVTILAFNNFDALIAQQTTNNLGYYTFAVGNGFNQISNNTAVRLEYLLPNNCVASSSFLNGGLGSYNYGSNVQFTTQTFTPTVINFALNDPNKFRNNSNNPTVFVSRLTNGNPIASPAGNSATATAFYSFNYTANQRNTTGNSTRTSLATAAQIGACWGIANNKYNSKVYTSALVKRFSGLGPGGPIGSPSAINAPGSIYEINPSVANSGKFFFSMDALGPAYYTHNHTLGNALCVKDNVSRGLLNSLGSAAADPSTFDQVGKTGIGDIELSDDGRYLWLTNLYNQMLYRIDLTNANNPIVPTPATAASLITSWSLPALPSTNGVLRPWGLKYYHNKIYVGVVNSGENHPNANSTTSTNTNYDATTVNGGSFNNGNANVLEFDPAGAGTWNNILTIPLNYPRGNAADENYNVKRWFNWANSQATYGIGTGGNALIRPQPILSSIEFDVEGSLMIAFMDRIANQTGLHAWNEAGTGDYYGESGGDLLRAYNNNCGNFELESNGKEGSSSPKAPTAGANHGQGPGTGVFPLNPNYVNDANYGSGYGEFYFKDRYWWSASFIPHNETNIGAIAFLPGSNEIMSAVMDPYDINSNGVLRFSNLTGDSVGGYEIIPYAETGTFAKAASLGDIEILENNPPIEIGNIVWSDSNNDGIQSADEIGVAGVVLELYNPTTTTVIGTVTTNAKGNYYFTSATGTSIPGVTYNLNILPNTNYVVRLATSGIGSAWDPTANSGSGAPRVGGVLMGKETALTAVVGNGIVGQSDNDAVVINGVPSVAITTGNYGQTNFNVDFGFKPAAPVALQQINFNAALKDGNVELNWLVDDQSDILKYIVEHSNNATTFSDIINPIFTSNTSLSYNAFHYSPNAGENYYRLKIFLKNNTVKYSEVRKVKVADVLSATIFPNPVKDVLNVKYSSINKQNIIATLYNIQGVLIKKISLNNTSSVEKIDLSTCNNGIYILKIVCGENVITKKVQVMK